MNETLLTLGIESSCDETAVAVLRGTGERLSSLVATQTDLHARYGGVVPEVASRRHADVIRPMVAEALAEAGVGLDDIGLVGATRGPGLVGALLVGLSYAKGLAWARNLPLVGVNHLEGHMAAALLAEPELPMPALFLLVSGGHTELYLMRSFGDLLHLGGTRDDAVGEAYDKVAKMLGMGYPGGALVDAAARRGKAIYDVPVALPGDNCDFSFSGPKTAVRQIVERGEASMEDVCASFQKGAVAALVKKTTVALDRTNPRSLAMVGGVACNSAARQAMRELGERRGMPVAIPEPHLCSDNGLMIAAAAARKFFAAPSLAAWRNFADLDADPGWMP